MLPFASSPLPTQRCTENLMRRTVSMRSLILAAFGLCLAAPLYAHHVQKGSSTTPAGHDHVRQGARAL